MKVLVADKFDQAGLDGLKAVEAMQAGNSDILDLQLVKL